MFDPDSTASSAEIAVVHVSLYNVTNAASLRVNAIAGVSDVLGEVVTILAAEIVGEIKSFT